MILDIFTILFFVLGFALIFAMIGERHRDVLHGPYVIKSEGSHGDSSGVPPEPEEQIMPRATNVLDELSRIVTTGEDGKSG